MRIFMLAALAALFCTPALAQEGGGSTKTVYVDYAGACGGSLIETRRRERIEREADRIIAQLVREGSSVRVVVRDDSVILGHFPVSGTDGNWRRRLAVYNRNFSCGY